MQPLEGQLVTRVIEPESDKLLFVFQACCYSRLAQVMRLQGILQCQVPKTMYAVLLGAARFVNSYHGARAAPNAEWFLDVSKGANPGALTLRAKTRNNCGISSRSEVLVSYGLEYDLKGTKPLVCPSYSFSVHQAVHGMCVCCNVVVIFLRKARLDSFFKNKVQQAGMF